MFTGDALPGTPTNLVTEGATGRLSPHDGASGGARHPRLGGPEAAPAGVQPAGERVVVEGLQPGPVNLGKAVRTTVHGARGCHVGC